MDAIVTRIDELEPESQDVPDSLPVPTVVRLPGQVSGRSFSVLVRFPAGWSRPYTGYYESTEEIFLLEGGVAMSGATYSAGDYGWFPAGYLRSDSSSPGSLTLAWFSGPARWRRSEHSPEDFRSSEVVVCRRGEAQASDSPLGPARRLRSGRTWSSFLLDRVDAALSPPATWIELLAIDHGLWVSAAPGSRIPAIDGPAFCRLTRVEEPPS
jgi:hypothetical protein